MASVKITILSDNCVLFPQPVIGEHGFAALVERGGERVLLDTGRGFALLHNARVMGVELASLRKVALSHGHSDHTGGLAALLELGGRPTIFAHPGVFAPHFVGRGGDPADIGIPFERAALEARGGVFDLAPGFRAIAPGIHLTGEVPRRTAFETGDPTLQEEGGRPDPLSDDLSLVAEGEAGLVVLLGCAHAGVVNILRWVEERLPGRPIHTVIGGTHLGFASEEQIAATLEEVARLGVERLGASHCTGLGVASRLRERLGERFFFAGVGTVIEV